MSTTGCNAEFDSATISRLMVAEREMMVRRYFPTGSDRSGRARPNNPASHGDGGLEQAE